MTFCLKHLHGIILGLLLVLVSLEASGAEPKRVLLIHSFGRDFAPYNAFSGVLRSELVSRSPRGVDIFEVTLDLARVSDAAHEGPLVSYLTGLTSGGHVDLVIPIGGPAVQFAQRYQQGLFPRTPMLMAGVDERLIQQDTLTPNEAVVAVSVAPAAVVRTILQVLPQTTNILVAIGASPLEEFWLNEIRADCQGFTNRVSLQSLNQLSFPEMLKRCAALPPQSAVLYAMMAVDAEGVPQWEEDALARLHEVSSAPLFGVFETQLGKGIVGGPLVDLQKMGRNTATVAARILNGETPGGTRMPPQEMGSPQFDWRELRRWDISEARLPAGSVVRFRPPGIWERYWWLVCIGALLAAVESALTVGLLINRARRRQGETTAALIADLSSRFINLPVGMVDLEIEQAQRRVCESMGLELSALWQWADRASGQLRMTHLYRPQGGPPIPERFDAQEAFPWSLRQLQAGKVVAVAVMDALPAEASRDRESWLHFGIKSNLTFPLLIEGGQLIGGLSFNTVRKARSWPRELVTRLELVAQIFGNALARKRADQELRESEARLSLAADAAGAGLWSLDLATQSFWLTKQTRELFAFSADETVTFKRVLDLIHPGDQEMVRQAVQVVIESKADIQVEYRILRPDGSARWMQSQGRLHVNGAGQPMCLMGVTVDVTPRKRAEEALRGFSARLIITQEEERSRLARELHDDITQRLARLAIDAARAEAAGFCPSPDESGRTLREEIIRLSEDVHALSYRLHPSILEDLGLAEALRAEAERFQRQGSCAITLKVHGLPESLAPEVSLCLFRVAQEALRNAVRHSHAQAIMISLRDLDGGLQLAVQDDGCGFDPAGQSHPSLGLASMRERVRLLRGELEIESAPRQGTTVLAWVPLTKLDEPAGR